MNRRILIRNATALTVTLLTTAAAVAAGAGPASAAPPPAAGPQILAVDSLPQIIHNITVWVIGLLVGVATLFATIGTLRYMAAGGDPAEIDKAKGAIRSAFIGYALALLIPVLFGIVRNWLGVK